MIRALQAQGWFLVVLLLGLATAVPLRGWEWVLAGTKKGSRDDDGS